MTGRIFQSSRDEDGTPTVIVSLGRKGSKTCVIDEASFLELMEMRLSPTWDINPEGYVMTYSGKASGGKVSPARVLMNAGIGEVVRYRDNDPRNLRRSNLEVIPGNAIRKDKELV